jgi:predicted anti-sigma-YlaC factor YlaD
LVPSMDSLESRIVDATSTGEMLSCVEFDKLIERYFDGVILGPTFQNFQAHFAECWKCRRLLNGIEEAKEMLREAREDEMEVPGNLARRIMAATVGAESDTFLDKLSRSLKAGQWVAAALILAASSVLINWRYGSVENLATAKQEQLNQAVIETGSLAVAGVEFISVKLNNTEEKIRQKRQADANSVKAATTPAPDASPREQIIEAR